jgi:hypothetical protein
MRNPVFVYVDEAQEYFDERIETILTQARKYRVGLTLAHQTLDQLSPRLRAAIAANTSFKCVGGVSAKDARAMADELHTTAEFIEGMRRRPDRTEFAAWVKQVTPRAVRLTTPIGVLERRPQMSEEVLEDILAANRARYGGTPCAMPERRTPDLPPEAPAASRAGNDPERQPAPRAEPPDSPPVELAGEVPPVPPIVAEPLIADGTGKGGRRHRYLQHLIKELAEQQGFRAAVEAPVRGGAGQIDVLLTRGDLAVAVEISVTTPPEQERENLRKCLTAGYERVVLVLAKSARSEARHRAVILEGLAPEQAARVTIITPEEAPDFIAGLSPPPDPSESTVRGYKVRVSQAAVSPAEARARRETLARLVARSLQRDGD